MLSQQRLKQLLDYNETTGTFTWKTSRRGICKAGKKKHLGYFTTELLAHEAYKSASTQLLASKS